MYLLLNALYQRLAIVCETNKSKCNNNNNNYSRWRSISAILGNNPAAAAASILPITTTTTTTTMANLGIPLTGSTAIGFAIGLFKG